MGLSQNQKERYSRQLLVEGIGEKEQLKLQKAKVLIVGAGGLGSPVSLYLAAAGVGSLGLVDGDCVELSNLQRQIIHGTEELHQKKVESAKRRIEDLNPEVNVNLYPFRLDNENASRLVAEYDMVVDCTDNFMARFLVNDVCVMCGKPFVHGSVSGFSGHVFTHIPGTACYRCIFKAAPPASGGKELPVGVIGSAVGVIGSLQATEVLKYLTNRGNLLTNRLLCFDGLQMQFNVLKVRQDENCAVCGK